MTIRARPDVERTNARRAFGVAAASLLAAALATGCGPPPPIPKPAAGTTHVADAAPAPSESQIDVAVRRGVEYLVKSQNKDGSWGSPAPTLTVDIYAPGPGAHEAYATSTSALCVSALCEAGDDVPGVPEAIRRGTDYLLSKSRVRRTSIDVIYNTWTYGYGLEALAKVLAAEKDPARREKVMAGCRDYVDMLGRFEYVEGGWGYYDFRTRTQHPGNMATSFTTATVLVGMRMAKDQGVEIPQRLVDRAVRVLGLMRFPSGAFAYSIDHRYYPQGGINKVKGSLARTPACYAALRGWGGTVTDAQLVAAFEHLRKEGRFLAIARKYPYPHETWYQNSGYFTFYGYDYATRLLATLPAAARAEHAASIASYLAPLQEPDGSWWDYQLYGYHKPYGTAMVVMSLARCR